MILVVTAETAALLEPDVLTALSVRSALPPGDLADAVARQGLGRADPDGAHLWLERVVLRGSAAADPGREAALAGMIAYAAGRGWVDEAGRIRAHLEHPPA